MWRISNKRVLNFTLWITKIEKRERKPKPFGAFFVWKKVVNYMLVGEVFARMGLDSKQYEKTFLC